jgi:hypothetical protein
MTARHDQPRLIDGIVFEADFISRARKNLEDEAVQHTRPHMPACMALCLGTLGPPMTAQGEEGFPHHVSFTVLDFVLHDSGPINHYDVILW